MSCLWWWFGLKSFKAKLIALDSVFWGSTTVGLETRAASLGSNWEFVPRTKLQDTPVPPLVFKWFSASDTTLPNLYKATLDNPIQVFHFIQAVWFPQQKQNKQEFSHTLVVWYGTKVYCITFVICHPSTESKSAVSCVFPQWRLILPIPWVSFTNSLSWPNLCFRFSFFTYPIKNEMSFLLLFS